ncbi:unnamed protein product [Paramecium sonneborni]|uniref:Homeodomain protein n=1 Tax=Paramecium sonneborni TaxID=65129 RepID=A0A8S1NKT5_9CILI|nr:unnamed protein product [Paramecium sonneborni]
MDNIFDNIFKIISAYKMNVASDQIQENGPQEVQNDTKFVWIPKIEDKLKELYVLQQGNWKSISAQLNGPTPLECMYKWQQLHPDQNPSRQLWSPQEDEQLKELVKKFGKKWSKICTVMNWRTGKQVRERYLNQLQGTINQDKWTEEEDKMILKLYRKFGTKWSYISSFLNGRPENMVKNRFYANLKRRYQCDIVDSDDDEYEENSDISSDDEKIKLQKRRKLPRQTKDDQKQKKIQVQEVNSQNFQIITRSKLNKKNDENSLKLDCSNQDHNNENNSVLQNANSLLNNQVTNIKEENLLKFDQNDFNSSIPQQPQFKYLVNQDVQMINNSNVLQQYQNILLSTQSSPNVIQNQNQIQNLQQNKQSQFNISQQPYVINQYPIYQMMNPYVGFVSPQQQFIYQLPCQSNYQDQINQLQNWNQLSAFYNNQLLQNGLQP